MKLRRFLFCSVVVSVVAIATILYLTDTRHTPQTTNNSVPEPSATSCPRDGEMKIQADDLEVTPAKTDNALDENFPATGEADIVEVKNIDAFRKTVDAISEQRNNPDMIFADLSGHVGEKKGKWRRFVSERELSKAVEHFCKKIGGPYNMAYNFTKGNRIVASNLTITSSSGDWVKDVYHCFREDGSLAFVMSHFRTFYDEYVFEQRNYFDRNGRLISKSEKYFELLTDEPLKRVKSGEHDGLRDKLDYYMTVSKLPFAHLLSNKSK